MDVRELERIENTVTQNWSQEKERRGEISKQCGEGVESHEWCVRKCGKYIVENNTSSL